jgi:hypothetical protein
MSDLLKSLPPVEVGSSTFFVDERRPVAAIVTNGDFDSPQFVTWPWATMPKNATEASVRVGSGGVWVEYEELADLAVRVPGEEQHVAVFVPASGTPAAVDLGAFGVVGVDGDGLWAAIPESPSSREDEREGHYVPSEPSGPRELRHYRLDGSFERTVVDRIVIGVERSADGLSIEYYETPVVSSGEDGGSIDVSYPVYGFAITLTAGLPASIQVEHHSPTFVTDDRFSYFDDVDLREGGTESGRTFDLAGVADTNWPTVALDQATIDETVEAALEAFRYLAEFWEADDGSKVPLTDGVSDPTVVTFRHPHFEAGVLRHSLELFDGAGRPILDEYANIWLMEKIDTNLPSKSAAVDGILDL